MTYSFFQPPFSCGLITQRKRIRLTRYWVARHANPQRLSGTSSNGQRPPFLPFLIHLHLPPTYAIIGATTALAAMYWNALRNRRMGGCARREQNRESVSVRSCLCAEGRACINGLVVTGLDLRRPQIEENDCPLPKEMIFIFGLGCENRSPVVRFDTAYRLVNNEQSKKYRSESSPPFFHFFGQRGRDAPSRIYTINQSIASTV